jgi:hypothetical protein
MYWEHGSHRFSFCEFSRVLADKRIDLRERFLGMEHQILEADLNVVGSDGPAVTPAGLDFHIQWSAETYRR